MHCSKLAQASLLGASKSVTGANLGACYVSTRALSSLEKKEYARPVRAVERGPTKMTSSEAFVETLVSHGVTDVFGIVGSAFMDALDMFPEAGIRFISTQHEQNAAHMADGYARVSGRHGVCIGQNGPGITNFVTGLGAAFYAHSPVVAITPECGSNTKGMGGFQEVEQLPIFETVTKYQAHIANAQRIPELMSNAFDIAMHEHGPTQINIPRDMFYNEMAYTIPEPKNVEYPCAGPASVKKALELIMNAKNPIILAGGGVLMASNKEECVQNIAKLSEHLGIPVATTYLHNDCFPCDHPNNVGPLGYQGFQSAMNAISNSDCVIAVGTRMNPFGTLPQYEMDYWPKNAKIIQCDIDSRKLGLTKQADCYVHSDCGYFVNQIYNALCEMQVQSPDSVQCTKGSGKQDRLAKVQQYKKNWEDTLSDWTFNKDEYEREGLIRPRKALRELENAMPENAVVSTDIGNICSVSNSYLRFKHGPSFLAAMTFGNCQYAFGSSLGAKVASPHRPCISYAGDGAWGMSLNEFLTCTREKIPTTAVVFNNGQWGAEKKNQVLWFGDRYIGVNLENPWSYASIAEAMGGKGIRVSHEDEVGDAFRECVRLQMEDEVPTVLEVMCTRELGDPFRRDAMKLPQRTLAKYQSTSQKAESQTGQPVDL